ALFAALGKEPNIEYFEMPVTMRDKYQYFTQADMSKLKNVGYTQEFTSLEDGINDYVQNYLTKEDPYF
ncbi:MAG: ADP-L-glycero-D-mannoheptose-6-epimerase, partial [Pseudomonadota bacterium]